MQKYVYTLCFLTGTPFLAGSESVVQIPGSIISPAELEAIQKSADKNEDSIVLQDGTTITGTLTSIPQLSYSFGNLPINVKDVAVIAFSYKDDKHKIQIITHEGYSYVADLPNENFIVIQYLPNRHQPKYTIQKEIAPSAIKYVTLKQKEGQLGKSKKRVFDIELKNGDHLPGSIATDAIALSTGLRDGKIKTDELLNLEVDFGIHGYTKNKQGQQHEFDYTYAKDKFLNLQIAQTQQTLGLPWALINKIQRVEPRVSVMNQESETAMIHDHSTVAKEAIYKDEAQYLACADEDSKDKGKGIEKKPEEASQKTSARHQETKNISAEQNYRFEYADNKNEKSKSFQESYIATARDEDAKNIEMLKQNLEELQARYEEANQRAQNLQNEIQNHIAMRDNLKIELNAVSDARTEMEELRSRFHEANQKAQSLQDEIQHHIIAREKLAAELYEVAADKAEIENLLTQNGDPESQIHLVYNLETEAIRARILEDSLYDLNAKVEVTDKGTIDLINRFEEEVKALQDLLSGKQSQVQFSEMELENTLKSIAKWKEVQECNRLLKLTQANRDNLSSEDQISTQHQLQFILF